jgi:MFS family permease
MMTPVGRLVLLRTVDKRALVDAMALVAMPAMIGPIMGPPLGGFITTYASWHWIFIINVPIGLLGMVLVLRYIEDVRIAMRDPFDLAGMVLAAISVAGLAFCCSVLGVGLVPWPVAMVLIAIGAIAFVFYRIHARKVPAPVLDFSLLALPTFRASLIGGFLFRMGIGALPFLLPLLLQVGFNYTPFQSGLTTFSSTVGAFTMKTLASRILKRFGFRPVLVVNAVVSAVFLAACAWFSASTPFVLMFAILLVGGFFRSLQFTSTNVLAYAEVDERRMSRATALTAVGQQLSLSAGVALGGAAVELTVWSRADATITAADFPPAFLLIALISAVSALIFARLPPDAGAELAHRTPPGEKT